MQESFYTSLKYNGNLVNLQLSYNFDFLTKKMISFFSNNMLSQGFHLIILECLKLMKSSLVKEELYLFRNPVSVVANIFLQQRAKDSNTIQ